MAWTRGLRKIVTVTLNPAVDRAIRVPNLQVGGHVVGETLSTQPAGKGVNVSVALARLGVDSTAIGLLGENERNAFERFLQGCGPGRIDSAWVTVPAATRESLTFIDPQNATETHIRLDGLRVNRDALDALRRTLSASVTRETAVVFAGSLPEGLNVDDLTGLVDSVNEKGGRVVLDAFGEVLSSVMGSASSIDASAAPIALIKPNREEFAALVKRDSATLDFTSTEWLNLAQPLLSRVSQLVVSLGADGAWLVNGDGAWRGYAEPRPTPVSTVGCGDCLLAGVLAAVMAGGGPEQQLRQGLAAASANLAGYRVADFDQAAVQTLAGSICVDRVTGWTA